MENRFVELYSLPTGVRKAIDQEDESLQIDRDKSANPFIVSAEEIDPVKKIYKISLLRDGFLETILVDSRKRKNSIIRRSYDPSDGWTRPVIQKQRVVDPESSVDKKHTERKLREELDFEHFIRRAIE